MSELLPMGTVDVCADCYWTFHGLSDGAWTGAPVAPLGYYRSRELSDGCTVCDPCGHDECAGARVCGCGYGDPGHGFSWTRCDGCGSHLGGDRFPLVVWGEDLTVAVSS